MVKQVSAGSCPSGSIVLVHNVSLPLEGHGPATAAAAHAWAAVPLLTSITSMCQKESRCQQACLGGSIVLVHNVSLPLNGYCLGLPRWNMHGQRRPLLHCSNLDPRRRMHQAPGDGVRQPRSQDAPAATAPQMVMAPRNTCACLGFLSMK